MIYMGVDQSLTGTGVVVIKDDKIIHQQLIVSEKTKNTKSPSIDYTRRLVKIKNEIKNIILTVDPNYIALEGMAFGARGRAIFDIGGLSHILRECFLSLGIPFIIVPPTILKKYWTGKGTANKGDMINEAKNRGEDIIILEKGDFDNNIVDSLALCRFISDFISNKTEDFKEQVEISWK